MPDNLQSDPGCKDFDSAKEKHPGLARQVAVCRCSCILRSWLRRIVALHLLKILADVVAYLLLDTLWHAVVDVYARIIHNRRGVHRLENIHGFALWKDHTFG